MLDKSICSKIHTEIFFYHQSIFAKENLKQFFQQCTKTILLDPKRNVLSWVSTLESSSKQSTNVTRETNISTTAYYCTVGKQGSRKIEPGKEFHQL